MLFLVTFYISLSTLPTTEVACPLAASSSSIRPAPWIDLATIEFIAGEKEFNMHFVFSVGRVHALHGVNWVGRQIIIIQVCV